MIAYDLEWFPGQMMDPDQRPGLHHQQLPRLQRTPGNPHAPFDNPFFLSLTQAFGTTGNEFDVASRPREAGTRVDWVRVWG